MSEESKIVKIKGADKVSVDVLNKNFENLDGRLKELEGKCKDCPNCQAAEAASVEGVKINVKEEES